LLITEEEAMRIELEGTLLKMTPKMQGKRRAEPALDNHHDCAKDNKKLVRLGSTSRA